METTFQPAFTVSLTALQTTMERAFKGYIAGDVQFTPAAFAHYIALSHIHLGWSLIAVQDEQPVGIAFLARRGQTTRIAGMGVVPEAQGTGIGRALLNAVIDQARAGGDTMLVLEAFEENTRAVRLYESVGFQIVWRLLGFSRSADHPVVPADSTLSLENVALVEAGRWLTAWGADDLPWQLSGATLTHSTPPNIAYRIGDGYAVVSAPPNLAYRIAIRALAIPPLLQRRGAGTAMLAALIAAFPGKNWAVPPLCPEEYAPLFMRNGFVREPLHQVLMQMQL